MERLLEILRRATSDPDATAADPNVQSAVSDLLLDPVERLVVEAGLSSAERRRQSSERPQYIAEYRVSVPGPEELRANLRLALDKGAGQMADISLGVTVCQAWADTTRRSQPIYPAHIRWGVWSHTPEVANRIRGPFAGIARRLDWPETSVFTPRPIPNMDRFTLSMLGKEVQEEDLIGRGLDELIAEIVTDLVTLEREIREP